MIPISPPESTRSTPRFPNDDNGAMVNVAPILPNTVGCGVVGWMGATLSIHDGWVP